MTLAEKIGQLEQSDTVANLAGNSSDEAAKEFVDRIRRGEIGSLLNEVDPTTINKLQRVAVGESRLGIPLIFGRDVIH
ncbi:MAG TPA: glycoside hydrolase family 3 N-terminal domain-containing protein, partial [Lacipirellulaceae bacterium]|nr:glycoside hydrolase family 3 N-terminal domain-containing protein [Lacipirellulaceae bacterium]